MRHVHPNELNAARLGSLRPKRKRWSKEEDTRLYELVDYRLGYTSIAALCREIADQFPGRSVDAIEARVAGLRRPGGNWGGTLERDHDTIVTLQLDEEDENAETKRWEAKVLEAICETANGAELERVGVLQWLARRFCDGRISREAAAGELEAIVTSWFPHTLKPRPRSEPPNAGQLSKKRVRRLQYAVLQRMYRKRRKDAVDMVLTGDWRSSHMPKRRTVPGLTAYWKEVFEVESAVDNRPTPRPASSLWAVIDPIQEGEVRKAIREVGKSSPGLDGLTAADVGKLDNRLVLALLNVLLLLRSPPEALTKARITLIPKVVNPEKPAEYRPIAIASVITRILHKVLASRWSRSHSFADLQLAFQKRDGCCEACDLAGRSSASA
ncbi:hypothetical protein FGIG_03151 [Fasciola gigantica]|uniref:Reverse transcriptase domain-containing protein n=1 Tax=Fasciola gigantica TaxID=46835 RepID=A0A504YI23_FASGI|nr:hypothetical protein FGIG_03151 [Fasciola gigantica]